MTFATLTFVLCVAVIYFISSPSKAIPSIHDANKTAIRLYTSDKQDVDAFNSRKTATETDEIRCEECGMSSALIKGRMINGDPVDRPEKYPWMVKIKIYIKNGNGLCGGSIINERFILTAAHCFKWSTEEEAKRSKVLLMTESPKTLEEVDVEEVIKYEKYSNRNQYDIALIKVKNPIKCTLYRRPICLPRAGYKPEIGDEFITAGWGVTESNQTSTILREITIKTTDLESCNLHRYFGSDVDQALCVKGNNTSICDGDSGGPMFKVMDGKYYVIGVTKGTIYTNCYTDLVFFFMSAPHFVEWIHNKTGLEMPA